MRGKYLFRLLAVAFLQSLPLDHAHCQQPCGILPEQRCIHVRPTDQLPMSALPDAGVPYTVADEVKRAEQRMSLDEAIHTALENAEVIRVLAGVSAVSSGTTIYDVAIANTGIDQQSAVFDPTFDFTSTYNKTDRPGAAFDPNDPTQSILVGSSSDSFNTSLGLSKQMFNGATLGMDVNAIGSYFEPGVFPLEPEYSSFIEMSLRQPLMRGFGRDVNLAPVVIAGIDTQRSFFQFKDAVQELVRGVIAAYWNLVAARVDVWAREQQIAQLEFAYERALARKQEGLAKAADVAQARSALANFRANLITARSNLILTETALRNILGLDPSNSTVIVPTSLPEVERIEFDWDEIIRLAEQLRPDIIELKLVLQADRVALVQADNQAKPQFDGIANYRWDGLSGEMPNGMFLPNEPGRFAGFNVGVNFSVPLGLRQGRAALRQQELLLVRDQANLDQGIFQMVQQLTINYRNLEQFFEQYIAFQEARVAARLNFENQAAEVIAGSREFINVLQAITDWGNAVSQEAASITQYNTELAEVERQTGTILETHGVRFVEERYGSLGPTLLGIRRVDECYPKQIDVNATADRYNDSPNSSDDSFNLEKLDYRDSDRNLDRSDRSQPQPPAAVQPVPPLLEQNRDESGKGSASPIDKPPSKKRRLLDLFR